MKIKIEHLNKTIDKYNILKNISLEFIPENINVIIGPNGAGKTSLLRIIGLLDKHSSGEIYFDTKSIKSFSSKEMLILRRKIGFVFQNPIVLEGTVLQNVLYGIKFRNLKIEQAQVDNIIKKVGLLNKVNVSAKQLSGGEKQRLQLARVLVLDPEIYILDEPTNNLDPVSIKIIENIIDDFTRLKKTVIFTTHNLFQARHWGKKIFYLQNGEIVQEGSPEEIFNKPNTIDIAEFSASENIFYGEILQQDNETYFLVNGTKINVVTNIISGHVIGIVRPEDILISKNVITSSARNCFKGKIKSIENIGSIWRIVVDFNNILFSSIITKQSAVSMNLKIDDEIYLTFKATSVHILPQPK